MLQLPDPIVIIETDDATNPAETMALVNEIKNKLNNDVFLKFNRLLSTLRKVK